MECSSEIKECIEFIQKVLPDFQPKYSSDLEFYKILSDGEILCSLLTEVSNGRIAYDSSHSRVLAKKNIQFFLDQCCDVFCLEESDLFEPDDLLTMCNPEKVVSTVLLLARKIQSTLESKAATQTTRNSGLVENIIKEMCDHERALINKLEGLLMYQNELLGLLSEWSDELVQFVFKHIAQLYIVHKEMHAKLSSLAEQGYEQFCMQLGTLFREMEPKLGVYIPYLCHLRDAHYRMETEFRSSPELLNQTKRLDIRFQGLGFRSLYDAPIRQTTNYLELFKRLHKAAQQVIPQVSDSLESLMQHWKGFLNRMNTFKKDADSMADTKVILGLVGNLPADLGNPEVVGLHLADDLFKVRSAKERRPDAQASMCVLTTKQIIVAAKLNNRDSSAIFSFNIPIVISLQTKKTGGGLEITWENGEKVILEESKSRPKSLDNFLKHIEDAKGKNFPKGWNMFEHRFELKTLPNNSTCSSCKKVLSGAVMQGYSCSHCIRQLDSNCLQQICTRRASLPNLPVPTIQPPPTATDFYHKNVSRTKAEQLLMPEQVGAFLLRDSAHGGMALSLKTEQKIDHINIIHDGHGFGLGNAVFMLGSLDELLVYYKQHSLSVHFSTIKCSLSKGILPKTGLRAFVPPRTLREEM